MRQYLKYENGEVTYPYSRGQLQRDNPTVSFPNVMTEDILATYNVFPYTVASFPVHDMATQVCQQQTPVLQSDGTWVLNWTVVEKTAEQIAEWNANRNAEVRNRRNSLLANSDWTQVADSPLSTEVKAQWATYRQSLRDISSHENFPNLADTDWPTEPS